MSSSSCVVCSVPTTKYRCPQCFLRYCSVVCCKTHKESCVKQDNDPALNGAAPSPHLHENDSVSREGELLIQSHRNEDDDDSDRVSNELLQELEHSSELKAVLGNPHLRAVLENLVNAAKPEHAIAQAMREPIFTEFADVCLQIVDKNNPNIEHGATDVCS